MDPLTQVKTSLADSISQSLRKEGMDVPPGSFEISDRTQKAFGDLSTPIVIKAASSAGRDPAKTAEKVAASLAGLEMIQKAEAVRGYLNFFIEWDRFGPGVISDILRSGENFGRPESSPGTLMLEHTSVNPTGPLNIARSRNSLVGDSLSRIYAYVGWKVRRLYLLNDVGHQIVVIYWGQKNGISSERLRKRHSAYSSKKDFQTLFTYVPAMAKMAEDPKAQAEVDELESRTHRDPKVLDGLRSLSRDCLEGQLQTLSRLGIDFDEITPESQFIQDGSLPEILGRLRSRKLLLENPDGSVGLDLTSLGLTRRKSRQVTLVKSDGSSTYTLRDIAYHERKFREGDLFITVLGEDHKREFSELAAILRILGHDKDLRAAFYSFVTYEGGKKMSTRAGQTVPLDEVMDEAIRRSEREVRDRRAELAPDQVTSIATKVGLGAVKFNILKVDPNKGISFRWDEAINFTGDSSAYVQYACARASSILRNAQGFKPASLELLSTPEERNLIWSLARTPGVVARSASDMKPNYVADHALDVSSLFSKFYMQHRVLQETEPLRSARLALVESVRTILSLLLGLLGIAAPAEI